MLDKDINSNDSERMQEDMDRIGGAADKMTYLLDDLLELSRVGRMVNPPEEIVMEGLVQEAVDLVAGQIAIHNIKVEVTNLPNAYGDRPRLLEVLQNLIDNAAKFIGEQASPCIEVGARHEDQRMLYYVKDNGMGIEPRYHEKVFGLFERLDQSMDGTGIGLAITRRIIELHGGNIWVESKGLGYGSTFYFTLPHEKGSVNNGS